MKARTKTLNGFTLAIIEQSPVSYDCKHLLELSFNGEAIGTILIPVQDWESTVKLKTLIEQVVNINSYGFTDYLLDSKLVNIIPEPSGEYLAAFRFSIAYHIKVTDKKRLLKIFPDNIIVEGRLVEMADMDNEKFAELSFYQYSTAKGLKPIGWMITAVATFSNNNLLQFEVDKVKHAKEYNEGYEFTIGSYRRCYFFDDDGYTFSVNGGISERVQFEKAGGGDA